MKFCALCNWSGDDSYERCPNVDAHPGPKLSRAAEVAKDRERVAVLAGGFNANGLRGPVRHYLSDVMDVYQTEDGQYVTADGQPVRGGKKRLR